MFKRQKTSLLSKEAVDRESLTHSFLNIKPRFFKGLRRLNHTYRIVLTGIACLSFLGYYPTFSFSIPPIHQSTVQAKEQKHEVISAAFPQPVSLPHPGYLSTHFSAFHPGVDIATGLGMPIHPITSGIVEEVSYTLFGYGNHVLVSHQNGFKSLYAHMSKIYVKKGQEITLDNILGEVGLTGHTSGPHTHLEITHNGNYIDPMKLLPELPDYPKPEDLTPQTTALRKTLTPDFQ